MFRKDEEAPANGKGAAGRKIGRQDISFLVNISVTRRCLQDGACRSNSAISSLRSGPPFQTRT